MEEKKTLILGAAGFIGTNLSRRLLEKGKRLLLFDRPGVSFAPFLQRAQEDKAAQILSGSFSSLAKEKTEEEIRALRLSEAETVYHLISTTCPSNSNRDVAGEMEENLIATIRFLDACAKAGVKKVVFLSSGGTVYGREHTGICREEEEAFPITSYGVQKLAIEKILYLYREMYGLDYRIVRLSNPYGPWQRPNGVQGAVTTFTYRALTGTPIEVYGDGSVVRDYIYIDDAVRGILNIAEGQGRSRLYNLGCGEGNTLLDVIEAIEEVLGKKPEVRFLPGRPVDVPVNVLDVSRYEADFGPLSPLPLAEGIRRLAEFYEKGGLVPCR
ncbi:MAG TPA: NAD-dependent epimerase/dehydratase family protein [Candidatus Eisenbergiella pullicola]|nr:NAD-dependent epimerase/dehydratase family protein [Candidatus Eisenbergiella pullicola]